jgi:O-palmitoleoyl-L-serine hydrolase
MYGSSLYWPETKVGEGILSTNPSKNIFANWTKVILLYCDGAFHQGMTKEPFNYKDSKLYFRGAVNTRAHFQYVHNRFNLAKADRIIISGSSAGGIATYIWADYLRGFIGNPSVKLYSIVDSGIFLDTSEELGFALKEGSSDQ